ncbi:NACHT domain-containing protein [Actinoallomurus rhizosphaericola]|uniref:NACHT domain-containing protein n=1 Tax=Actinoallomurus rhizosphaericola TaxID=2952536 RepID=UPI002093E33E|nr:hypothetical protein [Actinoallomurus rhizosphaericola]MCO5995820.1 hypothetical protein [Actinoallomurus rhizosphaericola]
MARAIAITGLLFGLVLVIVFPLVGLSDADSLSSIIGMFMALFSGVVGFVDRVHDRQGKGRVREIGEAQAMLGDRVRGQWLKEKALRGLADPAPLPVAWSSTGRPVQSSPQAITGNRHVIRLRLEGDLTQVAQRFRELPLDRHLVVIGEPGAGKTALSIFLVLGLLADLREGEPVPVLLSLSSWNPQDDLDEWMAERIATDHPQLDDLAIETLVQGRRIMPVLDGLDEIAAEAREEALEKIDAFAVGGPLWLTCRADEYEQTIERSGRALSRAAVVEIREIDVEEAIAFLTAQGLPGDDRWNAVAAAMRAAPRGPLASAFTTPLMCGLARTVYRDRDPEALLAFDTRKEVEDHLLDELIPTVYEGRSPAKARRYLGNLATIMNSRRTRDLSWWNVSSPVWRWFLPLVYAVPAAIYSFLWTGDLLTEVFATLAIVAGVCLLPIPDPSRAEAASAAPDPRGALRRRRRSTAWAVALGGLAAGLPTAVFLLPSGDISPGYKLTLSLALTLSIALACALRTPWGTFAVSRRLLAVTGRLPFDLPRFLEDAHERGVLRQAGAVYQFRHARLQDRLAARPADDDTEAEVSAAEGQDDDLALPLGLIRVGLGLLLIIGPTLWFENAGSPTLVYESGAKPKAVTLSGGCIDTGGGGGGVAACVPDRRHQDWTVRPGATLNTVFRIDFPDVRGRLTGLGGSFVVKDGCPASFAVASPSSGPLNVAPRHSVPIDALYPPGRPPKRIALTLTRTDDETCTAGLRWEDIVLDYTVPHTQPGLS